MFEAWSSGCLDTASHKPDMFAVTVNGKMKIANIAYKIIRQYMLVVQKIFTIKGQTGELGAVSSFDPIQMKKYKSHRLVFLPVSERKMCIILYVCVLG